MDGVEPTSLSVIVEFSIRKGSNMHESPICRRVMPIVIEQTKEPKYCKLNQLRNQYLDQQSSEQRMLLTSHFLKVSKIGVLRDEKNCGHISYQVL